MIVAHEKQINAVIPTAPGMKDAAIKALIGPREGWEDHVLRVIEIGVEGHTPKHSHPWPHINYILRGKGVLYLEDKEHPVQAGSFAYVPAGKEHQFRNSGNEPFRFICIVPAQGHK